MPNEFIPIVEEYDNKLLKVFKKVIEDAAKVAEKNKLNGINTYIYVKECLNQAYIDLGDALGYTNNAEPPMTDTLLIQICNLMEPYLQNARAEIQVKVDDIFNSNDLGELMKKYEALMRIFDNSILSDSIDSFNDIGPSNKQKTLTSS